MHIKPSTLYLSGVMLLVGLLLGVSLHRVRGETTQSATRDSEVGRYQLVSVGNAMNPYVYFLDTKTGRCWLAGQPGSAWTLSGPLDQANLPR